MAAQRGELTINGSTMDNLLRAVDLLLNLARVPEVEQETWDVEHAAAVEELLTTLSRVQPDIPAAPVPELNTESALQPPPPLRGEPAVESKAATGRAVRVRAENLSQLLALAGESVVSVRRLTSLNQRGIQMRRQFGRLQETVDKLRLAIAKDSGSVVITSTLDALQSAEAAHRIALAEQTAALDELERYTAHLTSRLYDEVLALRMRPFSEAITGVPRMVRETSRALGKEVRLEVVGENTPVDRDIAQQLETPLSHLLRNAIDHGVETPDERRAKGKSPTATIRLEARHAAGRLLITVSDDGAGIDVGNIRWLIVERKLIADEAAAALTEVELLEFLFLPAFSMRDSVTAFSGRGVGLDVVKATLREIGGHVRVISTRGQGTEFQMELPLTLSVIRAMIVEVGGEPYAFPVSRIERVLMVDRPAIISTEGRQHVTLAERQIGLVTAHQVLELETAEEGDAQNLATVVIGEGDARYGVVVDAFLGERDLVVRQLDAHLGKIQDIGAAALLDDGTPVLIIDVDDFIRSVENLVSGGRLRNVREQRELQETKKRILVVDDSLTVRELERKLLTNQGYEVEVAVDGMDAWNAVRTGNYNLIISDIDMPRMDGIELVTRLKKDMRLSTTPVVIVSYKDREDDRRRGLEAGADYYLTKGSFQDETLLRAVADLIGEASP